jgi:signal peptidase II
MKRTEKRATRQTAVDPPSSLRRWVAFALALAFALGADQLSKVWARARLKPIYPDVVTVIRGMWELRYSENPGAAFGMFRGVSWAIWVFDVIALAMTVGAVLYLHRTPLPRPRRVGAELGLLVGGALGNAIDRAWFGHVTDFVVWKAGGFEWHTFNVADAALVVGVVGLLFDLPRAREKPRAAAA